MNQYVFFIILFLSMNSQAFFTKTEVKRAWTETGFNFGTLFRELNVNHCSQSEKRFSACLMTFHELLLSAREGESYQLRISDFNELEIIPFQQQDHLTVEDALKIRNKRMESFRSFFKKLKGQAPSLLTQQFNNIAQQVFGFTRTIPQEDQSYLAGQAYNIFMKESLDPNSSLLPEKLTILKPDIFFGIGVNATFYQTESGTLNLVINPSEGSPAQMAGLKRGISF